ncbi:MAG: AMP-binding protein [Bacteroidota bacterium]
MDFRRITDILPYQLAQHSSKKAFACKYPLQWKYYSTEQCMQQLEHISAGLLNLGVNKGDSIAMIATSSHPTWTLLDIAMQQIGVVSVPIHACHSEQEILHIFNDAAVQYCIVQNRNLYNKISNIRANAIHLKQVYTFHALPDVANWTTLTVTPTPQHRAELLSMRAAIHEDDLATIVYTAGTTAKIKGVRLSHHNIISNVKALISSLSMDKRKRTLSFFPISYLHERLLQYASLATGASIYCTDTQPIHRTFLREVRPHYVFMLPRSLELLVQYIRTKPPTPSRIVTRNRTIDWAIRIGSKYASDKTPMFYWLQLRLAQMFVFRYWQKATGKHLMRIFLGSGHLSTPIARLCSAAGFNLQTTYGSTEVAGILAFSDEAILGKRTCPIFAPFSDVAIRVTKPDENGIGELEVNSTKVMLGYQHATALPHRAFAKDGWLKTGDLARIIKRKKHFILVGRITDQFKTLQGTSVSPAPIEHLLKTSPFIDQCMVVGNNRAFLTALIVPHFLNLRSWCARHQIEATDHCELIAHPRIQHLYNDLAFQISRQLSSHQHLQRSILLHESWTIENGTLTPNMELKRNAIKERFSHLIHRVYA